MKSFKFFTAKTIHFGLGVIKDTGRLLKEQNINNVLIVTDKFMVDSGLVTKITDSLDKENIKHGIFSEVEPSPTILNAENCYKKLVQTGAEAVIGFGGGSPADVAKVAAVLINNPPPIRQYIGVEMVTKPAIPIVIIPTTAGTGSEVSNAAILKDEITHIKGGVMSHHIAPTIAIVDPELTLTLPPRLTASTGMDALTHAIEGYVGVNASPMTEIYHKEAIKLITQNLRTAVSRGSDLEARYNMSLGAMLAGIGMATAGVGAVHALAYPMEGKYKVSHGDANGALLAAFVKFAVTGNLKKFSEIAELMGENIDGLSTRDAAMKCVSAIQVLCEDIGVPKLSKIGVEETDLDSFAETASTIRRLMDNSPKDIQIEDAKKIYKESF